MQMYSLFMCAAPEAGDPGRGAERETPLRNGVVPIRETAQVTSQHSVSDTLWT